MGVKLSSMSSNVRITGRHLVGKATLHLSLDFPKWFSILLPSPPQHSVCVFWFGWYLGCLDGMQPCSQVSSFLSLGRLVPWPPAGRGWPSEFGIALYSWVCFSAPLVCPGGCGGPVAVMQSVQHRRWWNHWGGLFCMPFVQRSLD